MNLIRDDARILVVRTSAVGDVLCALPALEAIRASFPNAFIGFLVEDRARDLIAGHPAVDRAHLYPRKLWVRQVRVPWRWGSLADEGASFVAEMRRENYDVAVDLQRNLKGAILSLVSGARLRVGLSRGYCREGNHLFSHVQVSPPPEAVHFADHFLAVARRLGAVEPPPAARLPAAPRSAERAARFLRENDLRAYAVVHPGTSDFGRAKRWPARRFSQLARSLRAEHGLPCVIAWGPGERELAEEVVEESEGQAVLAFQTDSILDLAELIKGARLFIGCDSGPMHLAAAVGTPCVALFGPKDPAVYGPYRHRLSRVVQPEGRIGPAGGIQVKAVAAAARSLLSEPVSRDP